MIKPRAALVLLAALAATTPVRAGDDPGTAVSGVGVSPPNTCLPPRDPPDLSIPAPKLVSTFPANGQMLRPGLLILHLAFDLPMACTTDLEMAGPDPCASSGVRHWILLRDRRDWTLLCRLEPGRRYSLTLRNFQGLSGREAEPYRLAFQTSNDPPVDSVADAMARDPSLPLTKPIWPGP